MVIFNIICIFVCIFLGIFCAFPSMNNLEKYWFLITLIFLKLFFSIPRFYKILLLIIVLYFKCLRIPIFTIIYIVFSMLIGITFPGKVSKLNIKWYKYMFNTIFDIKYSGYDIPKKPTIFICNYPANFLEYFLHFISLEKICIIAYDGTKVTYLIKLFCGKEGVIIVGKGGKFEETQKLIKDKIKNGYHILVYVEKEFYKRYNIYNISKIRTGMFSIAKNLNVTITPVIFDHIEHNYGFVSNKKYKIHIGKTTLVKDVDKEVKKVRSLFIRKLRYFKIK